MRLVTLHGRRYLVNDHKAAHLNPDKCPSEQTGSCPLGRKQAVFAMGASAAGKSTYISEHYGQKHWKIIDPDFYLTQHPDYDPENPGAAHYATAHMAEEEFQKALEGQDDFVLDTTGSRDKLLRRMMEARSRGFCTSLVFICAPLEASLQRNRARSRHVNEDVIREKNRQASETYHIAKKYADTVTAFDNREHREHLLGKNPYALNPVHRYARNAEEARAMQERLEEEGWKILSVLPTEDGTFEINYTTQPKTKKVE
jgi:predicted ABC-type ATPase